MTKRTLFSVLLISPVLMSRRERGTRMWIPFEARTRNVESRPIAMSWRSSVQAPVADTTWRARIVNGTDRSTS